MRMGCGAVKALAALDFYVHADLFMNPTAELADIVLPVATPFESENLKLGFEISADAQATAQLRRAVVAPQGEARSDTEIVFALATRLGLGEHFWGGDIEAARRHQLGPSGLSLEMLREQPAGIRLPVETHYRKYAEQKDGAPRGFNTPTRKVELYSETLLEHGYPPMPEFEEPLVGPHTRPDLAGALPAHPHVCEAHAVLRDAAPWAAEPAAAGDGAGGGASPGCRSRAGHRPGRLGLYRDAGGQRPAPERSSTTRSSRTSSAGSTAGGRPAPRSARPGTTRSARKARTSTCSLETTRSIL